MEYEDFLKEPWKMFTHPIRFLMCVLKLSLIVVIGSIGAVIIFNFINTL